MDEPADRERRGTEIAFESHHVAEAGAVPDPIGLLDTPTAGGKVIRGGALRIAGYVTGTGLAALTAAILTRYLGVVDWGRYVTVVSLVAMVSGLSDAGLAAIGVREYSTLDHGRRARFIQNLLGIRLVIASVGVVGATVFAVVADYGDVLVVGTVVSGVGILILVLQQTLAVPLLAALRLGWVTTLDLVRNGVMFVLVVILAAAGAGLIPIFAAAVPAAIVVLAANCVLVRSEVPLLPAFERAEWSRVTRLSVTYAAATAVGTIYLLITVVLTSLVGTSQETGYYGISFRIFLVVVNIPLLLVTSALPVLARAARDDRRRLAYALQRLLEIGAILGVWFALALVFGAEIAIKLIGGPKYAPAVGVLQIQGVAIIGTFISVTLGFVLLSLGQSRALLISNALALALSITLTLALVPPFGAKGAATATVVGEFALALFYAVALFGRGIVSGVSARFVGPVLLAAAAAAALALIPGLRNLPLVIAASVVYFLVLAALGAIPAELRAAFSEVMRARA